MCSNINDIHKAFDNILLYKMYNYAVRGVAYRWFVSYTTTRKHVFKVLALVYRGVCWVHCYSLFILMILHMHYLA